MMGVGDVWEGVWCDLGGCVRSASGVVWVATCMVVC